MTAPGGSPPSRGPGTEIDADAALRPMPLGLVIELGVRVIRTRIGVLLALALLVVGPGVLLTATVELSFTDVMREFVPVDDEGRPMLEAPVLTRDDIDRVIGAGIGFFGASAIAGLLGAIAALGFSAVTGAALHGRRVSLGEALRACLRRSPTAFGVVLVTSLVTVAIIALGIVAASLLVGVAGGAASQGGPGVFGALVVGVATVLAVVYLTVRWSMALPVAILEDLGTRHALGRTWELTGDNVWRTFAVLAGATLVTIVFGAFVAQVLALLLVSVLAGSLGLDEGLARTASGALASIVVAPIASVLLAVLYHDLRARHEGGPVSG